MVLDAKAMEWANDNGIDTAKLRAAKLRLPILLLTARYTLGSGLTFRDVQ